MGDYKGWLSFIDDAYWNPLPRCYNKGKNSL